MARKRANLTDLLNDLTFRCHYDRFKLAATTAHEWGNLPDGIQERHIEKWLFRKGKAVFFKRPDHGFMVLEVDDGGQYNTYGDPTKYIATGFNFHKHLNAKDCVIIENNAFRLPTEPFVMHYVNRITEADRTMDVNIKSCKTPVVFACDDNDLLSFKRIFQQVDGNTPAIFADKGLNLQGIQAYQTGVKFMGKELQDYANAVENKLLTFLGLNNSPVDKKERVLNAEANANNQLIECFADLQLEARKRACQEINEKFDLNITVKRRHKETEVKQDDPGADV